MSSGRGPNWVMLALEEHEQSLLRYAASLVGKARAADVVQDTFLRLCGQSQGALEGRIAPWLFRVCRNRAVELVRAERRHAPFGDGHDERSPDSGPGVAFERKEALTRVGTALGGLSERERELLSLKVDAGLRYREIAEVTGLSVSNVGFILHAAIAKLRKQLARDESVPVKLAARTT